MIVALRSLEIAQVGVEPSVDWQVICGAVAEVSLCGMDGGGAGARARVCVCVGGRGELVPHSYRIGSWQVSSDHTPFQQNEIHNWRLQVSLLGSKTAVVGNCSA